MLLVRDVFQARYGRGDELVALFKELSSHWEAGQQQVKPQEFRIMTDASGTFFTVVTEILVEDFATWERLTEAEFALPQFAEWFQRMMPLTESGHREFYHLVE
jgi:hypothetical protein